MTFVAGPPSAGGGRPARARGRSPGHGCVAAGFPAPTHGLPENEFDLAVHASQLVGGPTLDIPP